MPRKAKGDRPMTDAERQALRRKVRAEELRRLRVFVQRSERAYIAALEAALLDAEVSRDDWQDRHAETITRARANALPQRGR